MTQNHATIRFVTPEQFDSILSAVDRRRDSRFAPWFKLALRTLWATGCRPAEIVGKNERPRREPEEGLVPQSNIKRHHGLRARDVLGDDLLFIEGKNTNGGRGRAEELKARNVICADRILYKELQGLAAGKAADAHLFGIGPSAQPYADGYWRLQGEIRRLRRHLPGNLQDFEVRWLRHSWAVNALRRGIDLVTIQRQLGHSDLETTAIYLRFCPTDKDRVVAAFASEPQVVKHDCPACGFNWRVDPKTGGVLVEDRVHVAMMRRPR